MEQVGDDRDFSVVVDYRDIGGASTKIEDELEISDEVTMVDE